MPRITVDFSDVQDFEVLPKGKYAALIEKGEYRDFPEDADRHPYINLTFNVTEAVEGDSVGTDVKGRNLWSILSFSPKALWRMKQVFADLGFPQEELDIDVDDDSNLVVSPPLAGIPVLLTVSKRVYEGREQNQVDSIMPLEGGSKAKSGSSRASGAKAGKATGAAAKKRFK